jgi:hypothetical protein
MVRGNEPSKASARSQHALGALSAVVIVMLGLLTAGCTSAGSNTAAPTTTVTVTSPASVVPHAAQSSVPLASATVQEQAQPIPAASAADAKPDAQTWVMPDLRGKDLQAAQDAVQALTSDAVFFTKSHDLTGAGRHQLLDRDWQVCTQNVAPGATFDATANIDFGVVRAASERCP